MSSPVPITDEIRDSLRNAGIGKAFHDKVLADFGERGASIRERLVGPSKTIPYHLRDGQGMILLSSRPEAYDLFGVIARSLHIMGWRTCFTSPTHVLDALVSGDWDDLQRLRESRILFLHSMSSDEPAPFEPGELRRIGAFLHERMDEKKPIFMLCDEMAPTKILQWWPAPVRKRLIAMTFETMEWY